MDSLAGSELGRLRLVHGSRFPPFSLANDGIEMGTKTVQTSLAMSVQGSGTVVEEEQNPMKIGLFLNLNRWVYISIAACDVRPSQAQLLVTD